MTITTNISRSGPYAGAGTTGPFTVGFRFLENSHLRVVKTDAGGAETTLTLGLDYTVTGAGGSGGTITTTAPVAVGYSITIVRSVPYTQETDYTQSDPFPAQSHEDAIDKLTMLAQQNKSDSDRSLRVPEQVVFPDLPPKASRANTSLAFDSNGDPTVFVPVGGSAADVLIQLANTADATKGAGMTGNSSALEYPASSIGAVPYFINIREFGATRAGSLAANKAALQAAISAANARGRYAVVVVPPDTPYGYQVGTPSTWPSFAGVTVPLTVLDHSPGNSYAGYPSGYDGSQYRRWQHTPQTTSPGMHDGNTEWLRGAWAPAMLISNDAKLPAVGNPARTAADNRRATLFLANDGIVTWAIGQGTQSGAGFTDSQLSNFRLAAFGNVFGGSFPDGTNAIQIDRDTGNVGFHVSPSEAFHTVARRPGYRSALFESEATETMVSMALRPGANHGSATQDVILTNTAGALTLSISGSNILSYTSAGLGSHAASSSATYVHTVTNGSATTGSVLKLASATAAGTGHAFIDAYASSITKVFSVLGNGNVVNTNNSYGAISDEKLKQDVADATSQWSDIKTIRLRKYRFKAHPSAPLQLGVIAQEVEAVSPGLVTETADRDENGELTGTSTKHVAYSVLHLKALGALQEAMRRIEDLERRLAAAGIAA